MIKTEFYMGFSREDSVYYYTKDRLGKPCCKSGIILEIDSAKEPVMFTLINESNNIVSVPYEHIFKSRNLCFAYASAANNCRYSHPVVV